ncbi:MAG: 30S ribosomal protein S4 [bacterium]|nr:30S ribosomal protein S4 [Candidatus Microgenomates bacterium CPR3]MCQ3944595.1 30S ribosomal protein S4 [bacterium]RIK51138.1 MAG: 30S ribosomal protein S4 [Candidatus Microgenomates bacterium]
MARYTGPRNKTARRLGVDLGLKTNPKSLERRLQTPPGQHGKKGRGKMSDYGIQLAEKQKVKAIYGVLERQFSKYYEVATKSSEATGEAMLSLLERRLDNVIYRLHLAPTRRAARQIVSHGNALVNGRKLSIPSYRVNVEDVVTLSATGLAIPAVKAMQEEKDVKLPAWLDKKASVGKVLRMPVRSDISEVINEQLIVEFYSR